VANEFLLGLPPYLSWNLQRHGVSIERVRRDRVLHEALTARADPLHLALVFGLSHTTASKYTLIACDLLAGQPGEAAGEQYHVPGEPGAQLSGVEAVTGAELAARASIRVLMPFLCSAGSDGVGVLMGRFGCRPAFVPGLRPASGPGRRLGSCCVLPGRH
jgi:hypothetical protein